MHSNVTPTDRVSNMQKKRRSFVCVARNGRANGKIVAEQDDSRIVCFVFRELLSEVCRARSPSRRSKTDLRDDESGRVTRNGRANG